MKMNNNMKWLSFVWIIREACNCHIISLKYVQVFSLLFFAIVCKENKRYGE